MIWFERRRQDARARLIAEIATAIYTSTLAALIQNGTPAQELENWRRKGVPGSVDDAAEIVRKSDVHARV